MSYAHYFVKNYTLKQVVNLMCYTTRFPHTLTSTQKITRLYRNLVRRYKQIKIHDVFGEPRDYHASIRVTRAHMDQLMELSEDSKEFQDIIAQYETWVLDNMDPTMLIKENRPYGPFSGKYYVYSNAELQDDPYGFYLKKQIGGNHKNKLGHLFYQDFPYNALTWYQSAPLLFGDSTLDTGFSK